MKGEPPKIDEVLQEPFCLLYRSFQENNKKKKSQIGQTLSCFSLTVCFSHNRPCFPSFLAVWAWGSAGWVNASECTTGTGCWGTERTRDGETLTWLKWHDGVSNLSSATHLGGYTGVFQQHSSPHGWVTGHKLPVTANLGSSEQSFGIQVCEDTEEGCAHL